MAAENEKMPDMKKISDRKEFLEMEHKHAPTDAYSILIIEDNPNDRLLYKRMLEKNEQEFVLYETDNVADGLEVCRKQLVDCILLDYHLPDGDGIDFLKSCKTNELKAMPAIVMVTGEGNEQIAVEAMKLGALDYVTKSAISDGFFVQNILNAIERAQLKQEIKKYQRELEKSCDAMSEFTHTVSHDLKAPLRRINQYCDLLQEDLGDQLGEDGKEYIYRISVNTKRLQRLVDDLLTYSRTVNAYEEKEQVDLNEMISDINDDLAALIESNNATFVIDELPVITGFPSRLSSLFLNLIDNAIKYRAAEDPVIIISCTEDEKQYNISVQDNGMGIDPQHHQSIFKAFERLHSQDKIEGSGLGLSICHKVVEMHGGNIWVESEPGAGTVFKFTLSKNL